MKPWWETLNGSEAPDLTEPFKVLYTTGMLNAWFWLAGERSTTAKIDPDRSWPHYSSIHITLPNYLLFQMSLQPETEKEPKPNKSK